MFFTDIDLGDYKKCYKEGGRCRGLTFYSPQSLLQHHHLWSPSHCPQNTITVFTKQYDVCTCIFKSFPELYICISTLFVFAQYLCIVFVLITAHCPLSSAALWSPPVPFWSAAAAVSFRTRSETRDLKQIRQHLSCDGIIPFKFTQIKRNEACLVLI